jgi:hypothetical protein
VAADVDEIVLSLAAWRGRHLRKAWRPVIASDAYAWQTVGAQFGGPALLPSGESWPTCGDCGLPMRPMVQLDVAHLPQGLFPIQAGLLQHFQCANWPACTSASGYLPFGRAQLLRVVENNALRTSPAPPGVTPYPVRPVARWNEFWDLPAAEEHERLGLEYEYEFLPGVTKTSVAWHEGGVARSDPVVQSNGEERGLAETIADAAGGDKIGGWPKWVQRVEYPRCPECSAEMRFLLQLGWHDNLPESFGDLGTGYLTFCPSHPRMLAFAYQCS